MDLNMNLDLPFDGDEAESGGLLTVPGWYLAVVEDVVAGSREGAGLTLKFKISGGPFNGSVTSITLSDPAMADDTDKADKALRRLGAMAQRCGIWDGKAGSVNLDWSAAVGNEVVLEIEKRSYKAADGEQRTTCGPTYLGVYPPTHDRIPADERKKLGLPPAAPKSGKGEAEGGAAAKTQTQPKPPAGGGKAKPKRDYGNL